MVGNDKCHVCLGSYNEKAEHAKRQRKGAEESSRQQRRGARQGRATEQGSKAAEQGRAAGQGSRAGQQGSRAGQQAKFNLQTAAEVRTFVKKYVNFLISF